MAMTYNQRRKKMREAWNTEQEIEWINTIGASLPEERKYDRIQALKGYIKAAKLKDWGHMDKSACLCAARQLLSTLMAEHYV